MMKVMARNEQHLEGLLTYADVALRYGKYEESMSVLLRTVVMNQEEKRAKKMLTTLFQQVRTSRAKHATPTLQ